MIRPESEDPLERHRIRTERVISSRDEGEIKSLYVELGKDFWDRVEQRTGYEVPVLSAPETLAEVVDGIAAIEGLILDAGCGPNPAVAMEIAKQPSRVVVVLDIGWGMVRTATTLAADRGLTLLGVTGDVEQLPFRTGAFEGLVCDDTIEHLPNDRSGVAELARVLRPRGLALLATPNRHSLAVLAARLRDRRTGVCKTASEYFVASSHLREYTWREFERLTSPVFAIERRRPVGWRVGRKKRMISRVLWLPGFRRLSQMIVLQCHSRPGSYPLAEETRSEISP